MINKDTIKEIIVYFQNYAANVSVLPRKIQLEENGNYVFVGLRRVGKTYTMYEQIQNLLKTGTPKEQILFINFEEERLAEMRTDDLSTIMECYSELYDYKPIVFLDEIQSVPHWEKFARRLADSKYRVYITGSNAQMLSSEIATTLGGRFIIKNIFPYSFPDFIENKGISLNKNWEYGNERILLKRAFEEFFNYGGLPELLLFNDKRTWLNSVYQKIFFGDLIAHYEIRNPFALKIMVKKLAESVMQPISFSRITNIIAATGAKIGKSTVIDYLAHLQDTWLLFSLPNYVAKLADKESNKKYYFSDNGLLNLFLFNSETILLENLVAVELRKKYGENVFFYNKNIEVDFFIPEEKRAIQVSYSISDPQTQQREVRALLKLAEAYSIEKLEIITYDEELTIEENNRIIQVIPVWKWLIKTTDYLCK
jgi:predicted AAA+ superfamily ATPase